MPVHCISANLISGWRLVLADAVQQLSLVPWSWRDPNEADDLLSKRIHGQGENSDDRAGRAGECLSIDVVEKTQGCPETSARILENFKVQETTWALLEMLPLELAKSLADYHQHGRLRQRLQRVDHRVGSQPCVPVGHRFSVVCEKDCYDRQQCTHAADHGQNLELPQVYKSENCVSLRVFMTIGLRSRGLEAADTGRSGFLLAVVRRHAPCCCFDRVIGVGFQGFHGRGQFCSDGSGCQEYSQAIHPEGAFVEAL
jgi:hypothetical protein